MTEKPVFLHEKFRGLNTSPEVESAARRTRGLKKLDKKALPPQNPEARIDNYLARLRRIFDRKNPEDRARGLAAFKEVLHRKYIVTPEGIPESYWQAICERHRQEGRGEIVIPPEQKLELAEPIIADQKESLDYWIDYLTSAEAKYPDYLKYFAIRSMLDMGTYDKEKKKFSERTKGSISPFPDLNQDALSQVFDTMEKKHASKESEIDLGYDIPNEEKQEFLGYLSKENFAKMYAWMFEHYHPVPKELLLKTEGEWKEYPKGSDPKPLVESLKKYSTGWCLRGLATARRYLQDNQNTLLVYYSVDEKGSPTIPRVVIVTNANGQIDEVRGIAKKEHLDPPIGDVVKTKLAELPDGKKFEKKSQDMELLNAVEGKMDAGEQLSKDDLIFLYEIDSHIESFGLGAKDPRVQELRKQRDPKADAPIVFDCAPSEIAWSQKEVNKNTKAYAGPLFKGIFETLGHLEHLYTSFPEGKIRREAITIGGKDAKQLEAELEKGGFQITDYVRHMMKQKEFVIQKKSEQANLVRLTVRDLGFLNGATIDEVYKKAEEFGLELCPAEVGPQYRLKYTNQPMNEYLYVAMKQISDPDGDPSIFYLGRDEEDGVWLTDRWAGPYDRWHPVCEFVFRFSGLRK